MHSGLVLVLLDPYDFMVPANLGALLRQKVPQQNHVQLVERQTHHRVLDVRAAADSRDERPVGMSPAHGVRVDALGFDVVEHPGPFELVDRRRRIVRRAWVLVQVACGFEQLYLNALFGEEDAQEEA